MPEFYMTGGTVPPHAACYVERRADDDLLSGLLDGELCYVLTSRQMGKSSLMVRTAHKLRGIGFHVVVLDLAAVGIQLTSAQWYEGLALRIAQQIRLEDEVDRFWDANHHLEPCQRLFAAVTCLILPALKERVMAALSTQNQDAALALARARWSSLVIFIDELDLVRSLPFCADEFFGAIQACHSGRSRGYGQGAVSFCLLGVASPRDLIRDTNVTPFDLGRRIELTDFARGALGVLAVGLGAGSRGARRLDHIYGWTHGHPYLTQRLCRLTTEDNLLRSTASRVEGDDGVIDGLCEHHFLGAAGREEDDNLRCVENRFSSSDIQPALLDMYGMVLGGGAVPDDAADPVAGALLLSGIVRPECGTLVVRNQIYRRAFNREWVRSAQIRAQQ